MTSESTIKDIDVLVIGAGTAAVFAAIKAMEAGPGFLLSFPTI